MNESENKNSWFETNPKRTIVILVIAVWIILDTAAAMLLPAARQGNRLRLIIIKIVQIGSQCSGTYSDS